MTQLNTLTSIIDTSTTSIIDTVTTIPTVVLEEVVTVGVPLPRVPPLPDHTSLSVISNQSSIITTTTSIIHTMTLIPAIAKTMSSIDSIVGNKTEEVATVGAPLPRLPPLPRHPTVSTLVQNAILD